MTSFDVISSLGDAVIQPDGPLRIYFAHPITTYGTQEERDVLDAIEKWIGPDTIVVNPNTEEHQTNYRNFANDDRNWCRVRAFEYFLDIARTCNFCAFLSFDDRRVGSGVAAEIQTFFDRFASESRVYEWIPVDNIFRRRDASYFAAPGRVLTVEETRARINHIRTKTP